MDLGTSRSWRCFGCPAHGNHPRAGQAQQHADQTGHNVAVTTLETVLVFPEGQPPVPVEMIPAFPEPDVARFDPPTPSPSPASMARWRNGGQEPVIR